MGGDISSFASRFSLDQMTDGHIVFDDQIWNAQ